MIDEMILKAQTLVEALPYIQEFRNATIVVKFGGSTMEKREVTEAVLRDVVLLECLGMKPVIVHGGGKAINARLKEAGIEPHFINGLRYTCDDTIRVVDEVLHNQVNADLVSTVRDFGGNSKALSGKSIIKASKMVTRDEAGTDIDLGNVGEVSAVDVAMIKEDLKAGHIPIVTPVGTGPNGEPLNINADIAACKVAEALAARKLVFLSDVPGILKDVKDESSLISTVLVSEVSRLVEEGVIAGGMIPKIESAVHAITNGVEKVHMIDGRLQHALILELLTVAGIGTEIKA